jgi:hypothetical protein
VQQFPSSKLIVLVLPICVECWQSWGITHLSESNNLVIDSEKLAKAGRIDKAIRGFTEAKRWNLGLTFDPVMKARQLAEEGGKK